MDPLELNVFRLDSRLLKLNVLICIICYLASKARRLSWAYIYKWNKLIFWLQRNAVHNFLTNPGFAMRPATFETEFVHKYTTSWYFQGFPKVNHHHPLFWIWVSHKLYTSALCTISPPCYLLSICDYRIRWVRLLVIVEI